MLFITVPKYINLKWKDLLRIWFQKSRTVAGGLCGSMVRQMSITVRDSCLLQGSQDREEKIKMLSKREGSSFKMSL